MNKIKKTIAGLGIVATMAGGAVVEDAYYKDVKIANKMYSGKEYREVRKNIGNVGNKNNDDNPMTYYQIQQYADVLKIEQDKCGGRLYPINSNQDIRDQVKKFDDGGCP